MKIRSHNPNIILYSQELRSSKELRNIEDSMFIFPLCKPEFQFHQGNFRIPWIKCTKKQKSSRKVTERNHNKLIVSSLEPLYSRHSYYKDPLIEYPSPKESKKTKPNYQDRNNSNFRSCTPHSRYFPTINKNKNKPGASTKMKSLLKMN
ncbi:hypothetical protein SteCoe_10183 [Stentor coeruleus]|uniref:Uncharacterized protein n=1 Tax=Stentor coeruleus TaxID=5963 RepID=A0A1R2CFZ8_9CILI|nr:hypothetical protein SteCoe_10183 [Stentor coeruleus]